jgi:hypothetical protein
LNLLCHMHHIYLFHLFFAPHDELNTLQLLHMLIMYVYMS